MKPSRVWAATGFVLTSLTGGTAWAQDADFVLVNNTPFTVYSVHFWPSNRGFIGPDRLGGETMSSGEAYTFRPRERGCVYNVRVTLQENDYQEQWNEVDLCELFTLTVNYNFRDRDLWVSTN